MSEKHVRMADSCPLSYGQLDLWTHDLLYPKSTAYHVPMLYKVEGGINLHRLKRAVEMVIKKHAILRTRFFEDNQGNIRQCCVKHMDIPVSVEEYPSNEQALLSRIRDKETYPFDLREGKLARFKIFCLPGHRIYLYINIHHIIFDGMSIQVLLNSIKRFYLGIKKKKDDSMFEETQTYQYFIQQQETIALEDEEAFHFWMERLHKKESVSELSSHTEQMEFDYKSGIVTKKLKGREKRRIEGFCREHGLSPYALFMGLYGLILKKYKGKGKITILTPFANRLDPMFESEIGLFINMVLIEQGEALDTKLQSILLKNQENIYEAIQYGYFPLRALKGYQREMTYDGVFYYQNWVKDLEQENAADEEITFHRVEEVYQQGEFELVWEVQEQQDCYSINVRFNQNVHPIQEVQGLLHQLEDMLRSLTMKASKDGRIYEEVAKRAKENPEAAAIICAQKEISYGELEEKSNHFALFLEEQGVSNQDIVGIFMERSSEIIIAMLGIMKAGAVYLPIDVLYPKDRVRYMAKDSQMNYVVTDKVCCDLAASWNIDASLLCLEDVDWHTQQRAVHDWDKKNELAYLLYTSGSTGNPKGVQITHQGLLNAILSFQKTPGCHQEDCLLSVTTVCFDIAQLEIFLPLVSGGCVYFTTQAELEQMDTIINILETERIGILQATPSFFKGLIRSGWKNHRELKILCGGEELPKDLARKLLKGPIELWNMYGPTETTIWSCISKVTDPEEITIGMPIDNTIIYVLDENQKRVSVGEEGELYIGGTGLSPGYLGKEELTRERFIPNPFLEDTSPIYRTGDRVSLLSNGELSYHGRMDSQVKIRGYRVELNEIEERLKELSGIDDAVVVAKESQNQTEYLLAYVIPSSEHMSDEAMSHHLAKWLPRYMIPVKYAALSCFPTTLNQKIDRKYLTETENNQIIEIYGKKQGGEPSDNIERMKEIIMECMQAVIPVKGFPLNPDSNIGEYGFDSISFTELSKKINHVLKRTINPTMFYQYNTINKIAKHLSKQAPDQHISGNQKSGEMLTASTDDVAIVGISGAFPESADLDAFWENLCAERNLVKEEYIDVKRRGTLDTSGGGDTRAFGGYLSNIDEFDCRFFGISPREAEKMDPQQRLILEHVWKALEDAGQKPSQRRGSHMGVFIGSTGCDYMGMLHEVDAYTLTGIAKSVISNRVSFYFDWHGPSETVDTACSSSLVAIHKSVSAINNGECEEAVAGGINLILTPFANQAAKKVGMLSEDGACKTFDKSANGYVRGEGVAVIYLKKLEKARLDGDHIYGIIKGSSQNHGGNANSLTAPNADAQKELLIRAYEKANIDPTTVTYIETHGTGTELGDPIEVNGIKEAFKALYEKYQIAHTEKHCALGSVKTNIGHLEAAAGIASVLKVLLCMKNEYIPGNIHLKEQNPYIEIEDTPFYLVKEGFEWKALIKEGNPVPRRAGISSFGFGGVNAHIVIEEYKAEENIIEALERYVIPISARTQEGLFESVKNLLNYMEQNQNTDLGSVSYTLQYTREEMEWRAAFLVSSSDDLKQQLKEYLIDKRLPDGSGEDLDLIRDWVAGKTISWDLFYPNMPQKHGKKISLPTYPFKREKHWLKQNQEEICVAKPADLFVRDHVVSGEYIVPGAMQIEAGLEFIKNNYNEADQLTFTMKDIIWYRKLTAGETFRIVLGEQDSTTYQLMDDFGQLYSEGRVTTNDLDFESWQDFNELRKKKFKVKKEGFECYQLFEKYGFRYGHDLQIIHTLSYQDKEVLADLRLPTHLETDFKGERLYTGVLDGAFQTVLILLDEGENGIENMYFPFSVGKISFQKSLEKECMVYAHEIEVNKRDIRKFNIAILNRNSDLLVSIEDYIVKKSGPSHEKTDGDEVRYFTESNVEDMGFINATVEKLKRTLIFTGKKTYVPEAFLRCIPSLEDVYSEILPAGEFEKMNASIDPIRNIVFFFTRNSDDIHELTSDFLELFLGNIQQLLKSKLHTEVKLLVAFHDSDEISSVFYQSIDGALKSISQENPYIQGKCIHTNAEEEVLFSAVLQEFHYWGGGAQVYYHNQKRFIRQQHEIQLPDNTQDFAAVEHGDVVVITGGVGQLAQKHINMLKKIASIQLILLGRREFEDLTEEERSFLGSCGAHYISCDVSDYDQVKKAFLQIKKSFEKVDIILHMAGIIRDHYMINKTVDEFRKVLATKINASIYLDQVTQNERLKLFLISSSISGISGNAGQSDYAMANRFQDYFSAYRNRRVEMGDRWGRTISIDWPLWNDGGMKSLPAVEKELFDRWGIRGLDEGHAEEMFYNILASSYEQVLPIYGNSKISEWIISERAAANKMVEVDGNQEIEEMTDKKEMQDVLERYLIKQLSESTKTPIQKITSNDSFQSLGVDSVIIMDLNKELGNIFKNLSKTLFFEYDNVEELSGYLMENFKKEINEYFELSMNVKSAQTTAHAKPSPIIKEQKKDGIRNTRDIAVIGLGGKFPMAEDLTEFWNNLLEGKDCITEVPKERWDYRDYYDKEKGTRGKTYSKWGSFLDDIDKFDPLFFGISPMEAEMLDPQERLFIQTVWHAVEDAGYTRNALSQDMVGVYVGVMWGQYQLYGATPLADGTVLTPASSYASIANRVSYFFDFKGPSIALDTMCSSSLTSIHLACNSILSQEVELAVAGGVNLTLHPNKYIFLSQTKFASTDGRCRSFGEGGDGYVPGEAIGAVVLKPLEKAVEDGDHIYGVIKGTSINHGGRSNGYTVPNVRQQADVITNVYDRTGIDPRTVNYIEAHGTGTALGDPIEISSLTKVFKRYSDDTGYCSVGSVKSNIGHCESAAGIAGVTKLLLQMKYKKLVPSIHSKVLNENIDFKSTPFYVQRKAADWQPVVLENNGRMIKFPRRAAINSFGAGGANAHILFEEYEYDTYENLQEENNVFLFSAADHETLHHNVEAMYRFLNRSKRSHRVMTNETVTQQFEKILTELLGTTGGGLDETAALSNYFVTKEEIDIFGERIKDTFALDDDITMRLLKESTVMGALVKRVYDVIQGDRDEYIEDISNRDIAYTLQVGREVFKEKLAIVAKSRETLLNGMNDFLNGEEDTEAIYYGKTASEHEYIHEILSEEEGRNFIKSIIQDKKYAKLAALWVNGILIPWEELYSGSFPRRVSLPGYQFRKELCWLPKELIQQQKITLTKEHAPLTGYLPGWKKWKEFHGKPSDKARNPIVFYLNSSCSEMIKDSILQSYPMADAILIDASLKEKVSQMKNKKDFESIYLILPLDYDGMDMDDTSINEELEIIFLRNTFWFIQELDLKSRQNLDLIVITNNGIKVKTEVSYNAYGAALAGFLKSFAREYSNVMVLCIDMDVNAQSGDMETVMDMALGAVEKDGFLNYSNYAIRERNIYRRTIEPIELETEKKDPIHQNGCYVFIGGSGNIGTKLTMYFAENYSAKIVWIGRSPYGTKMKVYEKEAAALGGELRYYQADITDEAKMQETFEQIELKYEKIDGIFNLAMYLNYKSIQELEEHQFLQEIQSKVKGSVVLGTVIERLGIHKRIDFLVFFSSGEAFTGTAGWSTYALGCCFQDRYAVYLNEVKKMPAKTINWGYWEKEEDAYLEVLKKRGVRPLGIQRGMDYLKAILSSDLVQVMALDAEEQILTLMGVDLKTEVISDRKDMDVIKNHQNAIMTKFVRKNDKEEELREIKDYIKDIMYRVLKIAPERFEDDVDFTEYGVDSLIVTDLHKEFEKDLGKMSVTMLTEHTTINKLSKFLQEHSEKNVPEPLTDGEKTFEGIRFLEKIEKEHIRAYLLRYGGAYRSNQLKEIGEQGVAFSPENITSHDFLHLMVQTVKNVELEVFSIGEGVPILLIPAIGLTAPTWMNQISWDPKKYRIVIIHLPGYGISGLLDHMEGEYVAEAFLDVLNKLHIEKTHIIASCFGGTTAQIFAEKYPDRVKSMVLCGAFYENFGLPDIKLEEIPIEKMVEAAKMIGGGIDQDFDVIIDKNRIMKDAYNASRELLKGSQCVNSLVVMRYITQILSLSTKELLPNIKCPVLCIAGSFDTIVDKKASKYISEHVLSGGYVEIEGAGHYPYLTHADQFNRIALDFLEE